MQEDIEALEEAVLKLQHDKAETPNQ